MVLNFGWARILSYPLATWGSKPFGAFCTTPAELWHWQSFHGDLHKVSSRLSLNNGACQSHGLLKDYWLDQCDKSSLRSQNAILYQDWHLNKALFISILEKQQLVCWKLCPQTYVSDYNRKCSHIFTALPVCLSSANKVDMSPGRRS